MLLNSNGHSQGIFKEIKWVVIFGFGFFFLLDKENKNPLTASHLIIQLGEAQGIKTDMGKGKWEDLLPPGWAEWGVAWTESNSYVGVRQKLQLKLVLDGNLPEATRRVTLRKASVCSLLRVLLTGTEDVSMDSAAAWRSFLACWLPIIWSPYYVPAHGRNRCTANLNITKVMTLFILGELLKI